MSATIAIIVLSIILVLFLLIQFITGPRYPEYEEDDMPQATYKDDVQHADFTPRERAIIRSNIVKREKRRARQRKVLRRMK